MDQHTRLVLYGLVSWLVPFAASFALYSKQGVMLVDVQFFDSLMFVVGSLTAAVLLVSYFKHVRAGYAREGAVVGISWLAINLALDVLILLPMSKMSVMQYLTQVGLSYLVIPVFSITIALIAQNAVDTVNRVRRT